MSDFLFSRTLANNCNKFHILLYYTIKLHGSKIYRMGETNFLMDLELAFEILMLDVIDVALKLSKVL